MKITSNVHTHCTYCDGANTAQEMVDAALALGFTDLGFSCHSPAPYDPTCPGVLSEESYRGGIAKLRDEYRGRLGILSGMEVDTFSEVDADDYDYIIGSNHFLPVADNEYIAVDGDPDSLLQAVQNRYNGNGIAMAQDYYSLQLQGIVAKKPDIVGHFDLLKKYNRPGQLFDEESTEYKTLALDAMKNVLNVLDGYGGMLEINTGAMSRGLRDEPYPSLFLLEYAARRNARVIITSDSHRADTLNAFFDEAQEYLKKAGFRWMMLLQDGQFIPVAVE